MTDPLLDEKDPIEIILAFARQIEGARLQRDPMQIHDRDRWFVTLILALISDPHHHVGRVVGRHAFKTWIDRGGKVPKQGNIARCLKEEDQFEFAAQYLYDSGMKVKDIAMELGACELTIRQVLKYLSQEEYQSIHSEIDNEA
ncbi:MAG: hypothetical protein LM514_04390 [Streptococcus sp.]|nr:hypothetical protein [Streptococcus sp.]